MCPIYEAEATDFGIEPRRLLYDKSSTVKYDLGPNTSGILPSSVFRLRFKLLIPELNKLGGMLPDILFKSRFNVARTAILPSDSGIVPERRFIERSRSARRYIRDIAPGIGPVSWFRLSRARLSIPSLWKSPGSSPES